jgi:hypothetical protein
VEVNHEVDISTRTQYMCMKIKIVKWCILCIPPEGSPSTIPSFTQFPCIQYRYLWYLVPGTIIDQESDDLMNLTFALNYVLKK